MLDTPAGSALIDATADVLTQSLDTLTEEPDPNFSAAIQQNIFQFSGFKTSAELKEVSSLLYDENGNLRPFDQFKQDVLKLNEKYNLNYLEAEYNQAVQSAQMAAKWQDFEAHKDFVNLQYRTAGDEKVRAEHRPLDGTTLPVDDPFWDEYLPPLGWNCRCTVVEVLKDSEPVSDSAESLKIGAAATSKPSEAIFRYNPGKSLQVFPPRHPYFKQDEKARIMQASNKAGTGWSIDKALRKYTQPTSAKPKNGPLQEISITPSNVRTMAGNIPENDFDTAQLLRYLDKLLVGATIVSQTESAYTYSVEFLQRIWLISVDETGNAIEITPKI